MADSFTTLCQKAEKFESQGLLRRAAVAWRQAVPLGLTEKERDYCASNAARCSGLAKYTGKLEVL